MTDSTPASHSALRWLLPILALLILAAGFALSLRVHRGAPEVAGLYLPEARPLPAFALQDHRGQAFGPAELQGRWTVLAYGYTHCPDICPTTLASLAKAARALAAEDPAAYAATRFAFLSVDPARDTAARLGEYVPFFHPDFLGLRVDGPAGEPLLRALGIVAIVNAPADPAKPDQYAVDHGVAMYLLDPQGRLRAILRPEGANAATGAYAPEILVRDIRAVEAHG